MSLVCVHCGNPVVEIEYRRDAEGKPRPALARGELENKFKHGHPRPYQVCSVNPLMDEDVEEAEDESAG